MRRVADKTRKNPIASSSRATSPYPGILFSGRRNGAIRMHGSALFNGGWGMKVKSKAELEALYLATTYRIQLEGATLDLRIDTSCKDLPFQSAVIITAWNPHSVRLSDEENAERNLRMLARLQEEEISFARAMGIPDSDDWPAEESFALFDIDLHRAIELAREFGQNAIASCDHQGVRLVWA